VPPSELDLIQVLILAVVQGLTEFLPVSSSGHLVLAGDWLDMEEAGLFLPILLHVGTLVAVLAVYRKDVRQLIGELLRGQFQETKLIVVATLPIVIVGLCCRSVIKESFGDAGAAAGGLLVTSAILLSGEYFRRRNRSEGGEGRTQLCMRDAIVMGIAQAIAIVPGISRSGSTIGAGMMLGIRPDRAARFSFLMSIPAILGATILEGKDLFEEGCDPHLLSVPFVGLVVSALVGWVALRWLIAFVAKGAFLWFAIYCAALGAGYLAFS